MPEPARRVAEAMEAIVKNAPIKTAITRFRTTRQNQIRTGRDQPKDRIWITTTKVQSIFLIIQA